MSDIHDLAKYELEKWEYYRRENLVAGLRFILAKIVANSHGLHCDEHISQARKELAALPKGVA